MKKAILLTTSLACAAIFSGCAQIQEELVRSGIINPQPKAEAKIASASFVDDDKCNKLLEQVKKEDHQYLGEELTGLLSEINKFCTPARLEQFRHTSIGAFVGWSTTPVEQCNDLPPKEYWKDHVNPSFLEFCSKITQNPRKEEIQNYLSTYYNDLGWDVKKELYSAYPDKEDREIVFKNKIREKEEENGEWAKAFKCSQREQWKPFSGYALYGGDQQFSLFTSAGLLKELKGKKLKCKKTSFDGIEYCGEYALTHIFRIKNQKAVVTGAGNHRALNMLREISSRNIRSAILEFGLNSKGSGLRFLVEANSTVPCDFKELYTPIPHFTSVRGEISSNYGAYPEFGPY